MAYLPRSPLEARITEEEAQNPGLGEQLGEPNASSPVDATFQLDSTGAPSSGVSNALHHLFPFWKRNTINIYSKTRFTKTAKDLLANYTSSIQNSAYSWETSIIQNKRKITDKLVIKPAHQFLNQCAQVPHPIQR